MKKLVSIPNISDVLNDIDNISIDMSDLQFDCENNKKKFYAFIFIRNSGIKAELNFDNCTFEDKEEYLKMFLTVDIEINCPILASTWIEILSLDSSDLQLLSIFTKEEIVKFINRNKEFIDMIYQFINSLPLYSIYTFSNMYHAQLNMDSFECTDYNDLKVVNFYQLTKFSQFILLLNHSPSYNHRPLFFKEIFCNKENVYSLSRTMENLPYMSLMSAMLATKECQDSIIKNIGDYLEKE